MARILIVEDNVDLLGILEQLLSDEHEVLTAQRGEDAIALAEQTPPDAVILDLQLPNMNGIEAGRWMKRRDANIQILVLTAMAGRGDAEAVLASGCCDAYLAKPATLDTIRMKVRELLDNAPHAA